MSSISPRDEILKQIEELLGGEIQGCHDITGLILRLGAQRLAQELLEQERTDFLGRAPYERRPEGAPHRGWRNGYEPGSLPTAEGKIPVKVPQVRQSPDPFQSGLMQFLKRHSDVLDRLVVEMYARGLSTRDIEETFRQEDGDVLISRSAVSEIASVLDDELEAFRTRDLSEHDVVYLFLDAIYEPMRRAGLREAILCAWGITRDGMKVLLHLTLGSQESHSAWREMLREMVARGLKVPLTVTSDGAPALIRAIEEVFPRSLRIRCWVHKMRNVLDKVPDAARDDVKAFLAAIRDAPTVEVGQQMAVEVLERYQGEYPSAMRSLSEDLEASLAHLQLPRGHRRYVRTTNLIERSFLEQRRRTQTIPYFMTENSCLRLVFAALHRAAQRWRRVRLTELEAKQLDLLARDLGIEPDPPPSGRKGESHGETTSRVA